MEQQGTTAGQFLRGYEKGMELYDNPFIASIHAVDPDMAERVFREGPMLTAEEWAYVESIVGGVSLYGNTGNASWDTRIRAIEAQIAKAVEFGMGGPVDRGTAERFEVNEGAAREVGRTLAGNWNMTLSDEDVAILGSAFGGAVRSAYMAAWNEAMSVGADGAPISGDGIDPNSYAADYLRRLPEYLDLFGAKHQAETEEEYVAKFEQMSSTILGYDDPDAVRAGMESGDRNVVGQQALLSGTAEDSSTWQERAAGIEAAFRAMT